MNQINLQTSIAPETSDAPKQNTSPLGSPQLVGICALHIHTDTWDEAGISLELKTVELANRELVFRPPTEKTHPVFASAISAAARNQKVAFASNPIGRSVFLDLTKLSRALTNFSGTAPFFDAAAERTLIVPVEKIPQPHTWGLAPDGEIAFVTPKTKAKAPRLTKAHRTRVDRVWAVISAIAWEFDDAKEFCQFLNSAGHPEAELEMYESIVSAFEKFTETRRISAEEKRELLLFMLDAPTQYADDYIEENPPHFVTKAEAIAAMRMVHEVNGGRFNAIYRAVIRL